MSLRETSSRRTQFMTPDQRSSPTSPQTQTLHYSQQVSSVSDKETAEEVDQRRQPQRRLPAESTNKKKTTSPL
ncbi:Hypothetical predicted protein [Xyrichtys novacula]|uniref:Uncharacterized protein n=1 Tax=Xyrichtys novacula TaxID=13765 RepID=A0AAV1GFW7_XYRNO|nr:Hypothetical predicted protein [Xyrichtys novacula]